MSVGDVVSVVVLVAFSGAALLLVIDTFRGGGK